MAVKKTETKEVVKEEIVLDTKKDEEIERLKKEKEQMNGDLDSLKSQMAILMKQMAMQETASIPKEEVEVEVTCYCISGGVLGNNDGDIRYSFGYKETLSIPLSELKECFKSKINDYRDRFAKGMFVFEDKSMYEVFKIRDVIDMSDEVLVDMLVSGKIPYKEKMMVGESLDYVLSSILKYRVADLRRKGKLGEWSYSNQKIYETFFGEQVDFCVNQLELLNM